MSDVIVLSRPCAACGKPVRKDQPQRWVTRDGSVVVHAACRLPEDPPPGGTPVAMTG